MKNTICALLSLLSLALCGCNNKNQDDTVVSQRYMHKYGYAVTQQEWEEKNYPGQVITSLNTGVTVTATYENGVLHGPITQTYPHSQTVETYTLFNQGSQVKEISYDPTGIPVKEWVQLSPTRHSITMWYATGSPMLVEEFVGQELLDGYYYTTNNEIESRIEKGNGQRICRDRTGHLTAKEFFEQGYAVKKETYYPAGTPESIAYYFQDSLHGEKRTFAQNGEPLSIEEWINGQLHGKSTYFKNGNRYLEISYLYGQKNGIERHLIDGEIVSQEIAWENNQKHGPSIFYVDGQPEQQWFYSGELVSKRKFDELNRLDEVISNLDRTNPNSSSR